MTAMMITRIRSIKGAKASTEYRGALDVAVLVSLFLLSAQGLLNYAFRNTPLIGWKQAVLALLIFLAFFSYRGAAKFSIWLAAIFAPAVLLVASHFQGVDFQKMSQDIFYYVGWVPFYVYGSYASPRLLQTTAPRWSFWFIAISAVGFVLQLYTPYLNWLVDAAQELQYQMLFSEARRLALYFVASTIVMPTLAGFYCLICIKPNPSALEIFLPLPLLLVAAIPTGSLASMEVFIGCVAMAFAARSGMSVRTIATYCIVAIVGFFIFQMLAENISGLAKLQLSRVLTNNQYSDSNRGRLVLWGEAMRLISEFNPAEHLVGKGIGATHASNFGEQTLIHGESSFFQAYLEGGLFGLALRLAPFILACRPSYDRRVWLISVIYSMTILVACAVAPIFSGFGVQCTLGLIAGMRSRAAGRAG